MGLRALRRQRHDKARAGGGPLGLRGSWRGDIEGGGLALAEVAGEPEPLAMRRLASDLAIGGILSTRAPRVERDG
jgi:hypothetical protein